MLNNRPYVTLNIAMTADGKTDTVERRGATISSIFDMERVDRLRACSDAVMVGGRTLLGDDPRLTIKSAALRAERLREDRAENPIKVGVVTQAALRMDSRFFSSGPAKVIIFTTTQTDAIQIAQLRKRGVQVFITGEQRVDLEVGLQYLKQAGVQRLLVEGGGTLNEQLLKHNLVDEISVYIAPLIFGGENAPTFAGGVGFNRETATPLQLTNIEKHPDGGIVLHYIVEKTIRNQII